MIEQIEVGLPLVLVGLTSVAAYLVGGRALGLAPAQLREAGRQALECIGLTVVFLCANVTLGLSAILISRTLSAPFMSVYVLSDMSLVVLSALQGILFGCWRARRQRLDGAGA